MKFIALQIVLIFLCMQASAAYSKAEIPDTIQLRQVEVRAMALGVERQFSVQKLDTLALRSFSAGSLSDLMHLHSNLYIKSNGPGGLSTASFRGTTANHTTVLWNGFPVNGPQLGQIDFSVIPVYFVDHVSLAWSGSAINRPGGAGGLVELENAIIFNTGLTVDFRQSFGDFNTFGSFGSVSYGGKKLQVKTRLFNKSSENNFRYINTASWPNQYMNQKNADYHDMGFLQEVNLNFGKNVINFTSWNQWNDRNLPPIMTNLERGGDPKEFQNDRFHRNVLGFKRYWKGGKIEAKTALFFENQHYFLMTNSALAPYTVVTRIDSKNESKAWMNSFLTEQQILKNAKLIAQILFDVESVKTNNYESDQSRLKTSSMIGVETNINPYSKGKLMFRFDWINNQTEGLSPAIELQFNPRRIRSLYLTFGGSKIFRYPTMNDLFWFPGGNAALKPEKGFSTEFGATWKPEMESGQLKLRLSTYLSDVRDWIQWRPTAYRYWVPENIARVFARGLEWHQFLKFDVYPFNFQVITNFAYTVTTDESPVAKIEDVSGKQLIYIPRYHGNAFLYMHYHKAFINYSVDYTGIRNTTFADNDQFFTQLPAYTLHHLSIGYQLKRWSASFKVNNIFDKSYQAVIWRPMPGRNFEMVLNYHFESRKDNLKN